ncbi:2-C-methyl-D-erythritol 4-phosphate cytidylyltransferase [Halalkalibacter wakoensis JCM 9140]|uniref:2-C-methyl-D-erythritol 4-phosphate cytidylyltransferase n=1 Tax=Halalkalibacter wakoensis JCM 9140 TaxID=1236970 RepID=W4Q208_9BACI|nr:2-C-methyl-D-erythritol 4-phosphate cytidylyltransferase [Halalkalibacter wakoensis]GAE26007.1 2-C-methyl-D-erythritol 4-phosphate cytidylyltransferase [Halalkalibacter wakoensis JCM 9140]
MEYCVVLPAAGQGKRMRAGKNKQFLELRGEPLIVHTIRQFELDPWCKQVILVANGQEIQAMKELAKTFQLSKVTSVVEGGEERQYSVKNGIDSLKDDSIVLVHDGARPFITIDVIHRLVEKAKEIGAVTVAVPVKDTIKKVTSQKVVKTLNREELWSIQTPQAFKLAVIKEAHQKAEEAKMLGTDDASLVEWNGHVVGIVEGEYQNIKITTPDDMLFAEAILKEREMRKDDENRTRL